MNGEEKKNTRSLGRLLPWPNIRAIALRLIPVRRFPRAVPARGKSTRCAIGNRHEYLIYIGEPGSETRGARPVLRTSSLLSRGPRLVVPRGHRQLPTWTAEVVLLVF